MDNNISFNILDRNLDVHRNYLLEASAGTGKTFSIENIILRLLMEPRRGGEPLALESILVVTFTRAATRDLKKRVREAMENAINHFQDPLSRPDYIQRIVEGGNEHMQSALKAIQRALFQYDDAAINTIHRFCLNMLSDNPIDGNITIPFNGGEEPLKRSLIHRIIKDFFRSEIDPKNLSPAQIQLLLKDYRQNFELLIAALSKTITRSIDIYPEAPYHILFQNVRKGFQQIAAKIQFDRNRFLQDVHLLSKQYNKILDKKKEIKPEILEGLNLISDILEKGDCSAEELDALLLSGFDLCTLLKEPRKKSTEAVYNLFFDLHAAYKADLKSHLEALKNPKKIFSRAAHDAQQAFLRYVNEEEKFSPDDLLKMMHSSLSEPAFLEMVKNKFKAIIIDEFQDTDPLQWEIFEQIYKSDASPLIYLVGDPKQSIYAFRNADIYTYLHASKILGSEARRSLDINYRSHFPLVNALNALFAPENVPSLIRLPRIQGELPYRPVQAAPGAAKVFSDGKGAVQFFTCQGPLKRGTRLPSSSMEKEFLFPYIAGEILYLTREGGIAWNEIAILVRDRFQAESVSLYLKECGIQASLLRCKKITDTHAYKALKELIWAVLQTNDLSAAKIALGGKIIGWTYDDLAPLEDVSALERLLAKLAFLRETLKEKGFDPFFYSLLSTKWREGPLNLFQEILSRNNGLAFYRDLKHLSELLTEHQNSTHCSPEGLVRYLMDLEDLAKDDDERANAPQDISDLAINILTMHTSKGLEYDIVFALGVASRTPAQDTLFNSKEENRDLLIAADQNDPRYLRHCEESDAEKMRQLYVALTRSRYRTYIPITLQEDIKAPPEYAAASPMEIYLAQIKRPKLSYEQIYEAIPALTLQNTISIIEELGRAQSIGVSKLDSPLPHPKLQAAHTSLALYPPPAVNLSFKKSSVLSFSAIARSAAKLKTNAAPPHDFFNEQRSIHTLPSGSETGTMLHEILQEIGIRGLQNCQNIADIEGAISGILPKRFQEGWLQPIASMLWDLINLSLNDGVDIFTLRDIDPDACWEEMEFLTPCLGIENIEGLEKADRDYLKGFIDLIFEHRGKIYIVDWKSNWIGPTIDDYSPEKLQQAIESHQYHIQASIYIQAAKRLLNVASDADTSVEGAFYIFLRGIQDCKHLNQSTIFLRG